MVKTFDALAKFGGDENENAETTPQAENTASVDLSAVINRLNDLETAINELRREQKETKPEPSAEPTTGENPPTGTTNNNSD